MAIEEKHFLDSGRQAYIAAPAQITLDPARSGSLRSDRQRKTKIEKTLAWKFPAHNKTSKICAGLQTLEIKKSKSK